MKIVVVVNNYPAYKKEGETGWYLLADSAMTNTGKPFYAPEEIGPIEVSLAPAIRICRLGKFIKRKFASRYYSEFAPALHFHCPEMAHRLQIEGLPQDAARNFDRSLFVGDFLSWEADTRLEMKKNGEKVSEFLFEEMIKAPDHLIENFSVINTLKIGDIMLPALSAPLIVAPGDYLEVLVNNIPSFHVKVR
ncbi:MAG: hypothetical protein J1F12_01120 [Muribaculaceae bacterium]|nr:hypothetical protein [Muribaculaceae bacterium]